MHSTDPSQDSPYQRAYSGRLKGVLRWHDLDAVWAQLQRLSDDGWYVYVVGEPPPPTPATRDQFERFLVEIRQLLLEEHKEDYCGIVCVDDFALSRVVPDDLEYAYPQPGDRRHWWQKIFR